MVARKARLMSGEASEPQSFDLICLGRAAVDLYGEQIGTELEEVQSFAKSLGGCAANIAVGAARQGLRVSMLTRVGPEQMGQFVLRSLRREGIDTSKVQTDTHRLTGLVLLSVQSPTEFPLLFYRERCADMAISLDESYRSYIGRTRVLLLTGTHFSTSEMARVSLTAAQWAKESGARIVLDIDYRPVLWELASPGEGARSFVASERVADALSEVLGLCDLIVGTEDEVRMLGRAEDVNQALQGLRGRCSAALVLKLGSRGCAIYPVSPDLDDVVVCAPKKVVVYNVLGAGDAFMAGFLRGWLEGASWERCGELGNASGALVVGRRDCSPAMPTRYELDAFVAKAEEHPCFVEDSAPLVRLHRVTLRRPPPPELLVLAFDHRSYFERLCGGAVAGAPSNKSQARLKLLIARGGVQAARARGLQHFGVIIDGGAGRTALTEVARDASIWIARPIEIPDYRPLAFEGGLENVDARLRTWPKNHVVKCLVQYHPDGNEVLQAVQIQRLKWLQDSCVRLDRALLLEVVPMRSAHPKPDLKALPRALSKLYEAGLYPEWWKLPALSSAFDWEAVDAVIEGHDRRCRGILVLGLDTPMDELVEGFAVARRASARVRGFAIGRTIFGEPSERWLANELDDDGLVSEVASRYAALAKGWDRAAPKDEGLGAS